MLTDCSCDPFEHYFPTFSAGEFSNFSLIDVAKGMISIEGNQVNMHQLYVHGFSQPYFVTVL